MEIGNRARYYHYISGVFLNQMSDPLCSTCSALSNSIRNVKEDIDFFEAANKNLPDEFSSVSLKAKKILSELNLPPDVAGQKKAGNCKMPKGICFVKTSKAIITNI